MPLLNADLAIEQQEAATTHTAVQADYEAMCAVIADSDYHREVCHDVLHLACPKSEWELLREEELETLMEALELDNDVA